MPIVVPATGFGRIFEQTAKAGVGLTAGGSAHTMGSYATLIGALDFDLHALAIQVTGVSTSAADSSALMDIAVSPSGGGNEQIVIPFLDVGAASVTGTGPGKMYFFPLYVPAGKDIRARWQSITASDNTILVHAYAFEQPIHGAADASPQEWVQYGAVSANSRGTAVTSGSAAFGTDVQITSSTSRLHRWFHVGLSFGTNTTISAGRYRVRLARDAGAAEIIGQWDFHVASSAEDLSGPTCSFPAAFLLPAGEQLRIDIDGAAAEAVTAMVYAG